MNRIGTLYFKLFIACLFTANSFGQIPGYSVKSPEDLINISHEKPNIKVLRFAYINFEDTTKVALPKEIGSFKRLEKFDVFSPNMNSLPKEIKHLKSLTKLSLRAHSLESFPPEIGELEMLEELQLNFKSPTKSISNKIFELPNLKTLFISNWPEIISDQLGQLQNLKNLEELWILDTRINMDSIKLPESLTILDMETFSGPIPNSIYSAPNLETLKLNGINEGELDGISRLSKLKHLQLVEGNHLSNEIGALENLEGLFIRNNKTTNFELQNQNLKSLKKISFLDLKHFKKIPDYIYELENLEELYIYNCKNLESIPNEILKLPNLKSLKLRKNPNLQISNEIKASNICDIK